MNAEQTDIASDALRVVCRYVRKIGMIYTQGIVQVADEARQAFLVKVQIIVPDNRVLSFAVEPDGEVADCWTVTEVQS